MIRLREVTRRFDGQPRPVVDRLTLDVPAGRTCVLIGPSGCGKTTTLRMVNRLLEPTSGTIEVAGRDVRHVDPVELRRSIGYVIQQVGLFPHLTIAENVATVPRLLGWPPARIRERVEAMLTLVGLPPATYAARHPRALSGGERQRVGVARALAGDPPVMLMDEPFGAVDPITRGRLQQEFLRIFRTVSKTILFVTHDIDEALRMGDRLAIMREGRLVQSGTPDEILARPADAFVLAFLGDDRAFKRLERARVRDIMRVDLAAFSVREDARLTLAADDALGYRIVVDGAGTIVGAVHGGDLAAQDGAVRRAARSVPAPVPEEASARDALAAVLAAGVTALPAVDHDGRLVGLLTLGCFQPLVRDAPA